MKHIKQQHKLNVYNTVYSLHIVQTVDTERNSSTYSPVTIMYVEFQGTILSQT